MCRHRLACSLGTCHNNCAKIHAKYVCYPGVNENENENEKNRSKTAGSHSDVLF